MSASGAISQKPREKNFARLLGRYQSKPYEYFRPNMQYDFRVRLVARSFVAAFMDHKDTKTLSGNRSCERMAVHCSEKWTSLTREGRRFYFSEICSCLPTIRSLQTGAKDARYGRPSLHCREPFKTSKNIIAFQTSKRKNRKRVAFPDAEKVLVYEYDIGERRRCFVTDGAYSSDLRETLSWKPCWFVKVMKTLIRFLK
jgi:hypothetical protein